MSLNSPPIHRIASSLGIAHGQGAAPARRLPRYDWVLLFATIGLCGFGAVAIFSATHLDPRTGLTSYAILRKQLMWIVLGMIGLFVASRVNYRQILRFHIPLYVMNLLLLLAVLKLGSHEVKGAQRWINLGSFQLQPSEIAKISLIITLAAFLSLRRGSIRSPSTLALSLLHIAVPALIIFKQPDLGTSLVLMSIWLVMTFVAGANERHILSILLVGLVAFGVLWAGGGIKQYQKDRFRVFFNASSDQRGVGYHVTQAMDAIGSGRLWGKGLLHGDQGQLGYIPEQRTDFIFTIVGEELGFVGAVCLIAIYGIFLWRACAIAMAAEESGGRMLAAGIVAMFLYHVVVNLGMTVGIMPVTGVPLPFMSYGGSSILTNLCAVGLLQSIYADAPDLAL